MVLRGICGCMRSTPSAALEILFNISPLHIFIEKSARMTSLRLFKLSLWDNKGLIVGHRKIILNTLNSSDIFEMPTDNTIPVTVRALTSNYKILASTREQWI